jgi:cyclopropane fatty-acyl-phospholipid synthase-like methyltransferase
MKKEWWESFFRGAWIDYQKGMDEDDKVLPAADFLEIALGLPDGARILDMPCGEGRLAREMTRRGFRVTGVDMCSPLLKEAAKLARAEKLEMELIQGDMRQGPGGRARFDLAVCWWGSFGYFSDRDNLRHVKAVARVLKKGGIFTIDTHSSETLFPSWASQQWDERGGILLTSLNDYDHFTGRIETDWTLIKGEKRTHSHSSIRLYTVKEITDIFKEAGFSDYQCFGSLHGDPFELDSRRLIFVAVKG